MGSVDLSNSQLQIVTVLVNEYQASGDPVKGSTIADVVDQRASTVRNTMQGLKALDLVEGVPGPHGGYRPTDAAFDVLQREDLDERASVTLAQDFERVDVTVDRIRFPNVFHPTECTAHVHFQGSVDQVSVGDPIVVGPTPRSHLAVAGEVAAISDTADEIVLDVVSMEAPLTEE
ncbi:TrmB family transcriptional regulator [Halobacteria archaeon HArc-gm2]|nr:TrmB family transcriptional regulator [Halobacteria archaeon HArc-gm2]